MIKNSESELYTGITNDPIRRLSEHNSDRGSTFTKNKSEYFIVFLEKYSTIAEARKRESQIKKWSRKKKEFLIQLYQSGKKTII